MSNAKCQMTLIENWIFDIGSIGHSKTMDTKIVTILDAEIISKELHHANKRIVLAGGCFDLLHVGHLTFLQKAKEQGDILFVFVESDEQIEKTKGHGRPINIQEDRTKILAAVDTVDYVIPLPPTMSNNDYDTLVKNLKPDIIAATEGDPQRIHKERQAKLIGATVVNVTVPIKDQSTTRLIKLLRGEYDF